MTDPAQQGTPNFPPAGQWAFAAVFWLAGLAIIALAVGVIPSSPDKFHAPRWVLAAAGLMFVAGGFAPLSVRLGADSWLSQLTGGVMLVSMALVFNWIAFGPGTRQFSGGFSIGGSDIMQGPASESSGRWAFGAVAVLLDAGIVAFALKILRARPRA